MSNPVLSEQTTASNMVYELLIFDMDDSISIKVRIFFKEHAISLLCRATRDHRNYFVFGSKRTERCRESLTQNIMTKKTFGIGIILLFILILKFTKKTPLIVDNDAASEFKFAR